MLVDEVYSKSLLSLNGLKPTRVLLRLLPMHLTKGKEADMTEVSKQKNEVPLSLAIAVFLIAYTTVFVTFFHQDYGAENLPKLANNLEAFFEYAAQAAGGTAILPLIHVLIASIFKSKRNSFTRRKIFIGWSIFIIVLQLFVLLSTPAGFSN